MRPEYDFSAGERGKNYKSYSAGHSVRIEKADGAVEEHQFGLAEGVVLLDPDLRERFPDSKSVNKALRSIPLKG